MKLVGYKRNKGTGKNGEYDFFELYLAASETDMEANKGGAEIYYFWSRDKGNRFPCIGADNFLACLKAGLTIGSEVALIFDRESGHNVLKVVK